jgi:hypothetical protein
MLNAIEIQIARSAIFVAHVYGADPRFADKTRRMLNELIDEALTMGSVHVAQTICDLYGSNLSIHDIWRVEDAVPTVELIEDEEIELSTDDLIFDEETAAEEFFLEATQVFPKLRAVA